MSTHQTLEIDDLTAVTGGLGGFRNPWVAATRMTELSNAAGANPMFTAWMAGRAWWWSALGGTPTRAPAWLAHLSPK